MSDEEKLDWLWSVIEFLASVTDPAAAGNVPNPGAPPLH